MKWGKFNDKNLGQVFFVFNTHLDHVGQSARTESTQLLLQWAADISGDVPVLIAGDFNAAETEPPYKVMIDVVPSSTLRLHDALTVSETGHYGLL